VVRAINPEAKPRRCLYVSEGQPYQQARARVRVRVSANVNPNPDPSPSPNPHPNPNRNPHQVVDALVANTPEKTREIVLVLEREI